MVACYFMQMWTSAERADTWDLRREFLRRSMMNPPPSPMGQYKVSMCINPVGCRGLRLIKNRFVIVNQFVGCNLSLVTLQFHSDEFNRTVHVKWLRSWYSSLSR
jgi:hypothetical protein